MRKSKSQAWAWILLAAVAIFTSAIRIRLLQTPLERDEGEFGYMGQLILQGIPPYKIACNMKLPGTYAMYALFLKIFGNSVAGIHLGLMVMNLISIVLVFLLAKRLLGPLGAVVASASFGLMSLSPSVLGTSAHATQYVLPFALGGILLMLRAIDSGKASTLALSGLLLGTSFLMKQHAVFFLVFALLYYIWARARKMPIGRLAIHSGVFGLAMVIPYGLTCLILYKLGVFGEFWFWTYTYARTYASEVGFKEGVKWFLKMVKDVMEHSSLLWALGGVGVIAIMLEKRARANRVFLFGFVVFSFLTVCPGMYFRAHYFITFLPALALLIGAAVQYGTEAFRSLGPVRFIPAVLFLCLLGNFVSLERGFLFRMNPTDVSIMMYKSAEFPAMEEVSRYVKAHTKPGDKILVFGSEPEIYFYAQRHACTKFIYTYALVERHKYCSVMQRQMIREIKASEPKYVAVIRVPTSWAFWPGCDRTLTDQGMRYFGRHYELVGIAELISKDRVLYFWDKEAKDYNPASQSYVLVLRRRS